MKRTFLLFDMDGVLLQADGYHRAMQSALKIVGKNIGVQDPILTIEQISQFEAAGVTHEWETLAICTAILLIQIWQIDPEIRIPSSLDPEPGEYLIMRDERISDFLKDIDLAGKSPTRYAEGQLLNNAPHLGPEQIDFLKSLFGSGINLNLSPIFRVFQEYVLGSRLFGQIYKFSPCLDTESYLDLYDREALSKNNRDNMLKWLSTDLHRAAIFTNRPSKTPDEFFSTPDAELGAAAIGLEELPILGAGALSWFASEQAKPWDEYFKPHPVHVLAALQLASGKPLSEAIKTAADFYYGDKGPEIWSGFEGSKVYVFEDLTPGLISAQAAKRILLDSGIELDFVFVGVSGYINKRKSLSKYADFLIDDINQVILPGIISES